MAKQYKSVRIEPKTYAGLKELSRRLGWTMKDTIDAAGTALQEFMRGRLKDVEDPRLQGRANLRAVARLAASMVRQVGIEAEIDVASMAEGRIEFRVRVADPDALRAACGEPENRIDFAGVFGRALGENAETQE